MSCLLYALCSRDLRGLWILTLRYCVAGCGDLNAWTCLSLFRSLDWSWRMRRGTCILRSTFGLLTIRSLPSLVSGFLDTARFFLTGVMLCLGWVAGLAGCVAGDLDGLVGRQGLVDGVADLNWSLDDSDFISSDVSAQPASCPRLKSATPSTRP